MLRPIDKGRYPDRERPHRAWSLFESQVLPKPGAGPTAHAPPFRRDLSCRGLSFVLHWRSPTRHFETSKASLGFWVLGCGLSQGWLLLLVCVGGVGSLRLRPLFVPLSLVPSTAVPSQPLVQGRSGSIDLSPPPPFFSISPSPMIERTHNTRAGRC